jgi:hypothetical protein
MVTFKPACRLPFAVCCLLFAVCWLFALTFDFEY